MHRSISQQILIDIEKNYNYKYFVGTYMCAMKEIYSNKAK